MAQRILIVDDEPDLLELIRIGLVREGYAVEAVTCGREALDAVARRTPDLVILDVMLPDLSGTELCRRIRADSRFSNLPVLMLTAKGEEIDRVVGFELGADDYMTKPFSPRELGLRIRALLRRSQGGSEAGPKVLKQGALTLDEDAHRCFVAEEEVVLTTKEFQLLRNLMSNAGRVQTREKLLEKVWGSDVTVTTRTIDTHMKRLREKLGSAGDCIETVRGVGYRFGDA